jgi:hypothetical protein
MFSSTAPALASSHLLLPPRTCHQPHPPVSGEGHPRGQLLQQQAAAQGRTGLQPSRCLLRIAQPPVVLPALHLPLMEVVDINFNQFKLAACNSMTTNTSDLIFFFLYLCYPQNFCCCGHSVLIIYILPVMFDSLGRIYNLLCLLMAPVIYTSRYVLVLGHY